MRIHEIGQIKIFNGEKYFVILMFFGFFAMLIMLESCESDDGIIDSGRSALDYAYECEAVLGPLPKFSCADAIEVSSTKNGIPQTYPVSDEANGSANPNDCDHPWAFGIACQTGNKVGRYTGLHTDGSENPDVVFITFCRDGGLGVIGHELSTGETCFFSIMDEGNPNNSPKPAEAGYNEAWMTPMCSSC